MAVPDDEKYVKSLIAEGEHGRLDFKFEISSAKKIAKTLVSFANTEGGRLLIGVKDNGRVSGVRTDEEYYMIDAAASLYCKPSLSFESFHREVDGKTVLEIEIRHSEKKPHFAKDENGRWLAYHRVLDKNYLANKIQLGVWKREKRRQGTFIEYTENEKEILQYLNNFESSTFHVLKNEFNWGTRKLQNILINLVSLQVVSMNYNENEMVFSISDRIH
ncbi:MAG: ATP-binding protein [Bacteroidales bacterium]|nr:ATP-binding protein [Bacteroidales bacterium]